MPAYYTSREEKEIRFEGKPFDLNPKQVIFYDPDPSSAFSAYVDANLSKVKDWFEDLDYKLCYIPDICRHFTEEEIRYLVPNWKGEPLKSFGNDFLKPWLKGKSANIGAGFIRKSNEGLKPFLFFPLAPFEEDGELNWYELTLDYKWNLIDSSNSLCMGSDNEIRFSVTPPDEDGLFTVYDKKMSRADGSFSEEAISAEVKRIVEQLHKEGLEEFVLRCMVPVEGRLSRMVITPDYEIVLPDYGDQHIEMSPLPKAIYLLFLKYEKGLYFKELMDYKDELRSIYGKITNRTSTDVIDDSLDKVTDPTDNAINEKVSRIREAFVKRIDKSLAKSYCITGLRSERRRITLPRTLVEWRCEL